MKRFGRILWGVILIALGTIFALNVLEITDINIFFKGWWTLLIIIPCFIGVFTDETKTGNLVGLVIGVILLLCAREIIDFVTIYRLILPVALIIGGIAIICRETVNTKINKKIKELRKNKDKLNDYEAVFGGQNVKFPHKQFRGANATGIFGGVKLDLRDAIIDEDTVITTSAVFGGIDIFVPENVNVEVKSTAIFGGINNKTPRIEGEGIYTIYVKGFAMFGGVEIK